MARRPDAQLIAILGARGSGKTTRTRQVLAKLKPSRLAVWDTKREHAGLQVFTSMPDFIRAMKARTWRIAWHPTMTDAKQRAREFDLFCRAVYAAKRCTAVVEELAFVTRANAAPAGWQTLLLLGRDENPEGGGVTVVTTSQRPASVDKDLLGNCTTICTGRLPYEDDARLVARSLGIDFRELMAMEPLRMVEKRDTDRQARAFSVAFSPAPKAAPAQASGDKPKARNSTPEE